MSLRAASALTSAGPCSSSWAFGPFEQHGHEDARAEVRLGQVHGAGRLAARYDDDRRGQRVADAESDRGKCRRDREPEGEGDERPACGEACKAQHRERALSLDADRNRSYVAAACASSAHATDAHTAPSTDDDRRAFAHARSAAHRLANEGFRSVVSWWERIDASRPQVAHVTHEWWPAERGARAARASSAADVDASAGLAHHRSMAHARAGLSPQQRGCVLERADHRAAARRLGEPAGRLDLRAHRAGSEPEPPELARAYASRSARASGVPQPVWTAGTSVSSSSASAPSSIASSAAARSLSTTASTPLKLPSGATTTGTPPPPAQTTSTPCVDEQPDRVDLDDRGRLGRGDDAPPARAVGAHGPAARGRDGGRLGGLVDGADRLRRGVERGVVGVHHDLREQCRDVARRQRVVAAPAGAGSRSCPRTRRRARRADTRRPRRRPRPAARADPTCGPLPWVTISSCSRATAASAAAATPTLRRWVAASSGSPRRSSALPPSAATTRIRTSAP